MTHVDSSNQDNGILKRDIRGRVRTSVRRREALLDEFERSGLSGPKFSRVAGVCYQTFAAWMLKRRRARGDYDGSSVPLTTRRADAGPALMRWVEAETGMPDSAARVPDRKPDAGPATLLTVRMAGGVVAEVSHESQLALVAELARQLSVHFAKPC